MPEEKQKVARPRDPQTGRFIIFDNEQEKHVKALEERLENQRIDALQLSEEMAAVREENRLLYMNRRIRRDQLRVVADIFKVPQHDGQSVDDWASSLRDAYDAAMRADAETLYAPVVAERDRLKATLETERADAAAKVALLQKRCRFVQIAGYLCITLGCFGTYLACTFFGGAK